MDNPLRTTLLVLKAVLFVRKLVQTEVADTTHTAYLKRR